MAMTLDVLGAAGAEERGSKERTRWSPKPPAPPPSLASHPGGTQAPHLSHPEGPPGKTLVSVRQDAVDTSQI